MIFIISFFKKIFEKIFITPTVEPQITNNIKTINNAETYYKNAKAVFNSLGFGLEVKLKSNEVLVDDETISLIQKYKGNDFNQEERAQCKKLIIESAIKLVKYSIAEDIEYSPAYLLYFNLLTYDFRAKDRPEILLKTEQFLPFIDKITKDTIGYNLIKKEYRGCHGNSFNKVERHLSDFYFILGEIYKKEYIYDKAILQLEKAIKLMPNLYPCIYQILSDIYFEQEKFDESANILKVGLKKVKDLNERECLKRQLKGIKDKIKDYYDSLDEEVIN